MHSAASRVALASMALRCEALSWDWASLSVCLRTSVSGEDSPEGLPLGSGGVQEDLQVEVPFLVLNIMKGSVRRPFDNE